MYCVTVLHLYGIKPFVWGDRMNKKVTLACANCSSRNYTTVKNRSKQSTRLEVRKYCKICGEHTIHRETK